MRTTVTIDPDVEQLLQTATRQTGQSFKTTLNQAIRRGLADVVEPAADEEPFRVLPQPLGLRSGIDPARLQQMDEDLDVDDFLAVARRLQSESPVSPRTSKET